MSNQLTGLLDYHGHYSCNTEFIFRHGNCSAIGLQRHYDCYTYARAVLDVELAIGLAMAQLANCWSCSFNDSQ